MPKVRTGKTQRDRANNNSARNAQNKALRVEWQKDGPKGKMPFPQFTCNGKKQPKR